uniref:Uncharacterized protein n=1 Tax=Glossina pallidipes TaxID=7398 RepID=A0A1A9Z7F4_GLOPL
MTNAVTIFYWDKALNKYSIFAHYWLFLSFLKHNNDFNIVMPKNSLKSNANESTNMLFFNPLENILCPCGKKREDKHNIEVKTQGEDWPILKNKNRLICGDYK